MHTEEEKPAYERKYDVIRRLLGVLIGPFEVMRDIANSPDYYGTGVIIILQFVYIAVAFSMALSRFHVTGLHAARFSGMLASILGVAVVLIGALLPVRWLIKSAIVWKACDSGSKWSFKTAAAITGYAYVIEVIVTFIWMPIAFSLLPTFQIDTNNLEEAIALLRNEYIPQIQAIQLWGLPVSVLIDIWKSFLGGIGAHYGTGERCSKTMGILVFLLLSLLSLVLSYLIQ